MRKSLRQFTATLFGEVSWRPPAWLARSWRAAASWIATHRWWTVTAVVLLAALGTGAWWIHCSIKNRPRPQTISVQIESPGVAPLTKELKPSALWIKFGASVARVESVLGKPVSSGVRLEPAIDGAWKWMTDSRLMFTPKQDWPADRNYRVILDRALLPPHVLLERYELEAHTPPFTGSIQDLEFYTDPTDPAVKQVVATLQFTHSVALEEVEKRLTAGMIGGAEVFKAGVPRFTLTHGLHQRLVYLRTSPLTLPESEDFMRVTLAKGVTTLQGGAAMHEASERKVRVPDIYSFFSIESAEAKILRNDTGDPEQILIIQTTAAAASEEIRKELRVFLLPAKPISDEDKKDDEEENEWAAGDIDEQLLQDAIQLPVTLLPSGKEHSRLHSFRISVEKTGQLYVAIGKGVRALGGFLLRDPFAAVLSVPEFPGEIRIQGDGGVLALSGERKLAIQSRGIETIEYEIARVPADQINHLVSQTEGAFQQPSFQGYRFDEENIARIAREKQSIRVENQFRANHSVFDFEKQLAPASDGGSPMQGLFFLKAREWRAWKDRPAEARGDGDDEEESDDLGEAEAAAQKERNGWRSGIHDSRFILVTDLGLIVKENADGSRDVFVASIKGGTPLPGVAIEVIAKNGVPLLKGTTAADGRAAFTALGKLTREKAPVAFVARLGDDVAFMPYDRDDRRLDLSRFDIGGVESASPSDLDAFVFTERGIYRPGDEIHVGVIVKHRDWAGKLEGLPIEVEVVDAREASVQVRKLALPAIGFAETSYRTAYESPTGVYSINVFLVREGKRGTLLGSTSVHVKEFLPDRMKIESRLSKEAKRGWVTPDEIKAELTLRNLYGTPATARRVKAHLALAPGAFHFDEFAGFSFFDRLREAKKELKSQKVELGETITDEQGATTFDLALERFADATYAMTFHAEGFEAESGRSVATRNTLLVSALPYVVGYKADGDLAYIPMGSERAVEWIAIDPALNRVAVDAFEARLIERSHVSILTKQDNGNYAYQSTLRERIVRTESVSIAATGLRSALPTDVPGNFVLELRGEHGTRACSVAFTVIGRGAVARSLEKNAELEVKLSRESWQTGEEIELSIVAPYTGSGLITIERDKVYAHTWFKADATSSVQRIRVPADFEGTGYVNVCFVRALDSKEVFMSPLSYAAVPFQANVEKRRMPITLRAAAKVRPGEPLRIGYKADRPARIAIFAVDQGILQVSDYELPDPLGHFFRKSALLVQTSQIVDLILPEFSLLRNAAAFGGDGDRHLNPFKRITEKPVVFWSGVVDAEPREREIVYDVPDYFSGTLTIMAVAVAPDAVGSTECETLVRGPFVITPNVPTVATPGDQFEVSVTLANGVEGSGENAEVRLTAETSEHLEIVKPPAVPLRIAEGREITTTFTVRAREKFGSASVVFRASTGGEESKLRSTLSVRPAVPFMVSVRGGNFTKASAELKIQRELHPDFRRLETSVSATPLGLARGLDIFLKNYPNGCSEQITSAALCRLMLSDEADFGLSRAEVNAQLEHTFATLRRRQNEHGSFGYWAADGNERIDFVSAYVMHFLIEAKAAGFTPPANIFQSGLRHLQAMVILEPGSLREARVLAYAIYLLTREGVITTNYVLNLRDYLDKQHRDKWQADLTGAYLAGACALLKKSEEARRLISAYRLGTHEARECWDFHTALAADSQFIALAARHFPELLQRLSASQLQSILRPISEGSFNTLSAAYAVLALKGYSQHVTRAAPELGATELSPQRRETPLRLDGGPLLKRGTFSPQAAALRFTSKNHARGIGVFFQVIEAGYDRSLPTAAVADGLEIYREFVGATGEVVTTAQLGEPVTVRLRIRSIGPAAVSNVAITDLLPGAFEILPNSLRPGVGTAGFDYVEVREDRAVFFGTIEPRLREVRYQLKPTNRGEFIVPPVFAESMYDGTIKARGVAGKITVVDPK